MQYSSSCCPFQNFLICPSLSPVLVRGTKRATLHQHGQSCHQKGKAREENKTKLDLVPHFVNLGFLNPCPWDIYTLYQFSVEQYFFKDKVESDWLEAILLIDTCHTICHHYQELGRICKGHRQVTAVFPIFFCLIFATTHLLFFGCEKYLLQFI